MKKKKIIIPIIVIIILAIVGTIAFFLISGHEHSFGEWENLTPATCEDAEIQVRKCDCGEEETREGAPALGHVFTSISAECIMERPMEQLTLTPDDLKVTGKCERCDGAEITEGYEIEGGTLVLGENIVTIKYGDLSTTLNIWAYELDVALETIVLEDTYVSSSNKDNENTEKTEMGTKTDINRLYYKIDASEVLDSELFKVNKESAKVRLVLAITEGMVNEETKFTLKAFKPDTVDSDVDFTQLTWNNVDKTTGSYKSYNWGNADEILKAGVGSNVAIQRGYLMITLPYDQMEQYIDEDGMLLLAFGSNTSGFKVASLENKTETNHPRFEIVLNQEHIHVFDQEVIASKYLACDNGDGTIEYYKSCACGAAGTETFTVYTSRGDAYEVSAVITDDTYVSSADKEAKDTEHTQSKHLSTKYTTGRSYFRVNVKDALQSEQFKANSQNAMMQFVFCVTDGDVTDDTRYILKAYTPQKGVTDVNFKKLTWNSVDSTSGKYSTIHWSKGNTLVDSVVGKNVTVSSGSDKYITITVYYNQIAEYVDENGDVLFAFATRPEDTNADGIKIGSLENGMKAHRPVVGFLFDTEHSCSYEQKVVAEKYLASEATCEKKAQYYYSCECGNAGNKTFEYGDIKHSYKLIHKKADATCAASGWKTSVFKCNDCGKYFIKDADGKYVETTTDEQKIEKLAHTYGNLIAQKDPTCTETGMKAHYLCTVCGTYFDKNREKTTEAELTIQVHNCELIHKKADATCTASGWKNSVFRCNDCKKEFIKDADGKYVETTTAEQKIEKLAHTYGNLIAQKDPTCTETGMKAHYLCTVCGTYFDKDKEKTTEAELTIQVHNCKLIHKKADATCTASGWKNSVFRCNDCKKEFIKDADGKYVETTTDEQRIEKLAHTFDEFSAKFVGEVIAGQNFEANDFEVTGNCTACKEPITITDFTIDGDLIPSIGNNTVTISYGDKSDTVTIPVTTLEKSGTIEEDTYVNISKADKTFNQETELKTKSGSFRTYFKVNISDAIEDLSLDENGDNAKVELILKVTSDTNITETKCSLRAYNLQSLEENGTGLDISQIPFSELSHNAASDSGAYKELNWGQEKTMMHLLDKDQADTHHVEVTEATDSSPATIKITLAYSQIKDYVDENGYMLLAFDTETSGLMIGSIENATKNCPEIKVILNDSDTHFCAFNQMETTDDYLASEASCAKKAQYYYACYYEGCAEKGTKTFGDGDKLAHEYETITASIADENKTYYAGDTISVADFKVTAKCKNSDSCRVTENDITEDIQLSQSTITDGVNKITVSYKSGDTALQTEVTIDAQAHVHQFESITASFTGKTTVVGTTIATDNFKVSGTCTACNEKVTVDATDISIEDASGNSLSDNKLVAGINTITVKYQNREGGDVTDTVKIQATETETNTETVQVDCAVLNDTYVKTSSEKDNGFYDDATLMSYKKNDATSYRAYLRYNFSNVFDGNTFKGIEEGAIVQFTFTIANGTLTDAEDITFKYYKVSEDTNYLDVEFSDIYTPNIKTGASLEKLLWNNGKEMTFDSVTIEDTNNDSTTGNVGDKIIITVPYSSIKSAIDSDNKNAIFALVLDESTDSSELNLAVASLENTTYDSPTVSVTYTNTSAAQSIYFSTVNQVAETSETINTGDGTITNPYTSLDVLSEIDVIAPGTHIYLESGSVFTGSMKLSNISGTAEAPIVVTSYGTGAKPKIELDGLEANSGAIHIENCSYITVDGLEICDEITDGDTTEERNKRGVLITCDNLTDGNEDVVTYANITLRNLNIHDIKGYVDDTSDGNGPGMAVDSKMTGGIQLWSNDGYGRVDGLTITGCTIYDVSNAGIATWYKTSDNDADKISPYSDDFGTYAHSNVVIAGNEIYNIGKNAIFVRNLDGGVIEYNKIHDTAICDSGNMIVTSYVDGTVIQYNEGYNNKAVLYTINGENTYEDGAMLDADLASKSTIWQYNYSHDNAFGLFLNCTKNDDNFKDEVIVRYNLSVNDKGNKGIIYINYPTAGIYVYNNTIVTGTDTQSIIQCKQNNAYFYNNIIYNCSVNASYDIVDGVTVTASDNQIYNEENCKINNEAKLNNVSSTKPELKIELGENVINCEITEDTYVAEGASNAKTQEEVLQTNNGKNKRTYIKANISNFINYLKESSQSSVDALEAKVKLILTLNDASIETTDCMLKVFSSTYANANFKEIVYDNVKSSSEDDYKNIGWTYGVKLLTSDTDFKTCTVENGKLVLEFNYSDIKDYVDEDGYILFAFAIKVPSGAEADGYYVHSSEYQLSSNPLFNLEENDSLPTTSPMFGNLGIYMVQSTSDALLYGVDIADISFNSSQFTLDDFKVETDFFGNEYKASIGCCSVGVETETN